MTYMNFIYINHTRNYKLSQHKVAVNEAIWMTPFTCNTWTYHHVNKRFFVNFDLSKVMQCLCKETLIIKLKWGINAITPLSNSLPRGEGISQNILK